MSKNKREATKLLLYGDKYYQEERYREALLYYNRSLSFAEPGTQIASICYGKRALVYFDLKEYELCIANINLSLQIGPITTDGTDDTVRIRQMRVLCKKLMATHVHQPDETPMNFFKLSYPANERLPCLSNCLELCDSKKFGRHIASNRNLNVGDIVAVTDCSFRFFNDDARLHNCSYCTKNSIKLSLIPCTGCAKTMYCSTECMDKDKRKFHQYVCGIDDNPKEEHPDHFNFDPLRMFVHILDEFDGDVDEMKEFLKNAFDDSTVFDFDLSDRNDSNFEKNMIKATLSMRKRHQNFSRNPFLWHLHRFIERHEKLRSLWTPDTEYLDDLLCKLQHVQSIKDTVCWSANINMSAPLHDGNFKKPRRTDAYYHNIVASVIDPYLNLVNQSCFPNITVRFVNNRHVWIVLRPIQAGKHLSLFRGPFQRYTTPKVERQKLIRNHFGYKCRCDGCAMNWPVYDDMKMLTSDEMASTRRDRLHRDTLPLSDPDEYIHYACLIQGLSQRYPCRMSIIYEFSWMNTICRLAQPAKWFFVSDPNFTKTNCVLS